MLYLKSLDLGELTATGRPPATTTTGGPLAIHLNGGLKRVIRQPGHPVPPLLHLIAPERGVVSAEQGGRPGERDGLGADV